MSGSMSMPQLGDVGPTIDPDEDPSSISLAANGNSDSSADEPEEEECVGNVCPRRSWVSMNFLHELSQSSSDIPQTVSSQIEFQRTDSDESDLSTRSSGADVTDKSLLPSSQNISQTTSLEALNREADTSTSLTPQRGTSVTEMPDKASLTRERLKRSNNKDVQDVRRMIFERQLEATLSDERLDADLLVSRSEPEFKAGEDEVTITPYVRLQSDPLLHSAMKNHVDGTRKQSKVHFNKTDSVATFRASMQPSQLENIHSEAPRMTKSTKRDNDEDVVEIVDLASISKDKEGGYFGSNIQLRSLEESKKSGSIVTRNPSFEAADVDTDQTSLIPNSETISGPDTSLHEDGESKRIVEKRNKSTADRATSSSPIAPSEDNITPPKTTIKPQISPQHLRHKEQILRTDENGRFHWSEMISDQARDMFNLANQLDFTKQHVLWLETENMELEHQARRLAEEKCVLLLDNKDLQQRFENERGPNKTVEAGISLMAAQKDDIISIKTRDNETLCSELEACQRQCKVASERIEYLQNHINDLVGQNEADKSTLDIVRQQSDARKVQFQIRERAMQQEVSRLKDENVALSAQLDRLSGMLDKTNSNLTDEIKDKRHLTQEIMSLEERQKDLQQSANSSLVQLLNERQEQEQLRTMNRDLQHEVAMLRMSLMDKDEQQKDQLSFLQKQTHKWEEIVGRLSRDKPHTLPIQSENENSNKATELEKSLSEEKSAHGQTMQQLLELENDNHTLRERLQKAINGRTKTSPDDRLDIDKYMADINERILRSHLTAQQTLISGSCLLGRDLTSSYPLQIPATLSPQLTNQAFAFSPAQFQAKKQT